MKKLLIFTPHLSTGGAPEVTANKVELLKDRFELMVVEHAFVAWNYVIQRNKIINHIGDRFRSLGEDKFKEIRDIIAEFKPDVISMEEFPEMFLSEDISTWLYAPEREYTIVETTHDSSFNPANKKFLPDRFVFVSPFNSLKYVHLDVPQEVIEYPIIRQTNIPKAEYRRQLGLAPDYKHIVTVGLFTPRKNQRYAFELCDKLHEYKIKFHFLGNQAGNFESYWRPLMDWKAENSRLDNCVIWGERSDVDTFMKAVDMFLFPSKGDRGNKELNPIAIKEALRYPDLPKLMYNLDVYLNRYDGEPGMNYLTGDVEKDAEAIIRLINPKKSFVAEELIVVGTYPNLKSRVQLTKDTLTSLKALGRRILLISHYPVDEETQRMADFYVFDKENPLCHHSYYTRFYRHTTEFKMEMNINGLKHSNQSLTVLANMCTAAKMAQDFGFKRFFYTTYDVVLDERDIPIVEESFSKVEESSTAYLGTLNTPFGKGIQTNGMTFDTDFFLSLIDDVRTTDDYNRVCDKIGAQNFLEDYLTKKINTVRDKVTLIDNHQETLLIHSGLGVASNSEYYSILPIENKDNHFMFYFYTYNIDDRRVAIIMKEDGAEFFNGSFQISKSREFKKEFEFRNKNIDVELSFYDGDVVYKTENYSITASNLSKYKQTGKFKIISQPKVKLVHIQTTINDEREKLSRESLQPLQQYGIEYVLHTNHPYKDTPPKHNCMRPLCVSDDLFDEETIQRLGTALTPAHYGCYDAFRSAILAEFDDCDFLIVCEGDCLLEVPATEFASKVFEAAALMNDHNIGYFSFGDSRTLEHGWLQSPVIQEIGDQNLLYITNHIIGLQCIMFPKFTSKWLKERFRTEKWDASDMFFNQIFKGSPYRMGIVKKRITTQANGYSLIDKQDKSFL